MSNALDKKLRGFTVVSCFTQNKEELIIELNDSKTSFFIKASLASNFCCLSFPRVFNRARKNSVDLFPSLVLKKVIWVRQYNNERSFSLQLEGGSDLLFKMHGNRANIILFKNRIAVELFRNHLKTDLEIRLETLDRAIDFGKQHFIENHDRLKQVYFTLGKETWSYLTDLGFDQLQPEDKWALFNKTIAQLSDPEYLIVDYEGQLIFSLLPIGKIIKRNLDPIHAITEFFSLRSIHAAFTSEKSAVLKLLHSQLLSSQNFIAKNLQKLHELISDTHYQVWADLLMANMHALKQGAETVSLENIYDENKIITIKLKRDISPQKNAEVFYRKGKNQQIEIRKLKEAIGRRQVEVATLESKIREIENSNEQNQLRGIIGKEKQKKEKQVKPMPYHEVEFKGFRILIGRNAEGNDLLTLKYSFKDDLWLHAKDAAGSHVLIKHQSGKNFPKDVIERAAQLAAYNSKRKNESLCPVTVTPKKFVRKRKGDPAGAVVVEKGEVMLVEPLK